MRIPQAFLVLSGLVSSLDLTSGVPNDLLVYLPSSRSEDFGLYPQCELARGSGISSGICVPASYYGSKLPFCGEYVTYPSCVPPANPWWPTWNMQAKDELIETLVTDVITNRLAKEKGSLDSGGSQEYVAVFFTGNDACIENFKRMVCYYNFPRCDYTSSSDSDVNGGTSGSLSSTDVSPTYPVCTESCSEFFDSCRFGSGLTDQMCKTTSFWPLIEESAKGKLNTSSETLLLASSQQGFKCTGSLAVSVRPHTSIAILIYLTVFS